MQLNAEARYLFWFEGEVNVDRITELETKLNNLGIKFEVINGLRKPAIIEFGKGTSSQESQLRNVLGSQRMSGAKQ